jgi:serine/threonine protein kinase
MDTTITSPELTKHMFLKPYILERIPIDVKIFQFSEFTDIVSLNVSGAYGETYVAKIKNETVVLKKFRHYYTNTMISDDILREIVILQHLNQFPETKCVKFYGIMFNENNLYLVLEPLLLDLEKVMDSQTKLNYNHIKILFYKILRAFNAIHSLGIVHNDIKPGNIMLYKHSDSDNEYDIRIIDFGFAEFIGVGPLKKMVQNYICTELTKAPDDITTSSIYINGDIKYFGGNRKTYSSDTYSIAVTMIAIFYSDYYEVRNIDGLMYINNLLDREIISATTFGRRGYDLLLNMLEPDIKKRYTCKQALAHRYFHRLVDTNDIISKMNYSKNIPETNTATNSNNKFVEYSIDDFIEGRYELTYLEELHLNYMADIIPYKTPGHSDITANNIIFVMNWLEKIYLTDKIETLDVLINTLNIIQVLSIDELNISELELYSLMCTSMYTPLFETTHNEYYYHNIFQTDNKNYTLPEIIRYSHKIIEQTMCKIEVKPVWLHLQYIYLHIFFKTETNTIKNEDGDILDLSNMYTKLIPISIFYILFYYLFILPTPRDFTIWNVVQYSVIRSISTILDIDIEYLASNPFNLVIVLDNFNELHKYFEDCKSNIGPELFCYTNMKYL